MLWMSENLGLKEQFPNRVELWKTRCHNPLRRVTRRGTLDPDNTDALIFLLCSMSDRLYPQIHQLLSSREPKSINSERWRLLKDRFKDLVEERMNKRRGAVQRLLELDREDSFVLELVTTLSLSCGKGGVDRLRACLLDPVT